MRKIDFLTISVFFGMLFCVNGGYCASNEDVLALYVSTNGSDSWSGRLAEADDAKKDGPFATLERARDEIRSLKKEGKLGDWGVAVYLREGVYELDKTFQLEAQDSGVENAPIIYSAYEGETVRLTAGKKVTGFKRVKDEAILKRLAEQARDEILCADLKANGVTDYGAPNGGGAELFFNDAPMTLSRWPNEGFVRIVDIVEKDGHSIHGHKGSKVGKFIYDGERPNRWKEENDPWLHGYWFWDWSDERQRIESIDTENSVLSLEPPYHNYGYRKGQWYYAFNMLAELDSPGEWYIDREKGLLYFWPPKSIDGAETVLSILPSLVDANGASYVTLQNVTFEACRTTAINVRGGKGNQIVGCVVRNTGGNAIHASGLEHRVADCEIYRTGAGGIAMSGGDRTTLTPGGLIAENNEIHHFSRIKRMYTPGISLNGVGNRASHNLIHSAPHIAISFGGNEQLLEYNEIHHVCTESNDAGAIYTGRNWTMRGNVVRYNYLHHITGFENKGCVGVYLDDMFSSADIVGNVFYQVTRAAFIGGGRDCKVENNIFVDCKRALHIDARALGWAEYHASEWVAEATSIGTISGIEYTKPPYSVRYPKLVTILEDNPKAPVGNLVARNIFWCDDWDDVEKKAKPFIKFEDNLIQKDPHFADLDKLDFRLKADSPAFKLGFKKIPIEQIGLKKKSVNKQSTTMGNRNSRKITWRECLRQEKEWYGSDEAVRVADNVLLYQIDNGGWGKNVDMAAPLSEEQKEKVRARRSELDESTIDNGATYTQLDYLSRVYNACRLERFKYSFFKGLDFLLDAQYENGGWPQFPHKKGYHAHITFNDNATIGVMRLLDRVVTDRDFSFVDTPRKERAKKAIHKGIDCILKCQIVVDGKKTAWCAQHDESTLKPAPARSYEKISISGAESVGIVQFLMDIENPSPEIIAAVQSAMQWFDDAKLTGIKQEYKRDASLPRGYDKIVVSDPTAPPLWARFYEIGTNKPIFCGRDGIIKYSLAEIEHERRVGYSWYTKSPQRLFDSDYPEWRERINAVTSDK